MGLILLIVLVVLLLAAIPAWPHSRDWGYYPSGGLGLILIIILIKFQQSAIIMFIFSRSNDQDSSRQTCRSRL